MSTSSPTWDIPVIISNNEASQTCIELQSQIKLWSTKAFADLTRIEQIKKLAIKLYPELHEKLTKFIDYKFGQKTLMSMKKIR